MSLVWIDWLIVLIIFFSGILSVTRGFIKEAMSLVTWVMASILSWAYGGYVADYLKDVIALASMRSMVGSAVVFFTVLLTGGLIAKFLSQLVSISGFSSTDRFFGILFGMARGILVVTLLVGLANLMPLKRDPWWHQSLLIPEFLNLADKGKAWGMSALGDWMARGDIQSVSSSLQLQMPEIPLSHLPKLTDLPKMTYPPEASQSKIPPP